MLTVKSVKVHLEHYRVPASLNLPREDRCPEIEHLARYKRSGDEARAFMPSPNGGLTIATCTIGGKEYSACAWCSLCDTFSYERGRSIALGRLMKQLGIRSH